MDDIKECDITWKSGLDLNIPAHKSQRNRGDPLIKSELFSHI